MVKPAVHSQTLTLQRLFLIILGLGVIALGISCFVLLQQQRNLTLRKWQQDTLQRSTAITASYYSSLVTKMVSDSQYDVDMMLASSKQSEQLEDIAIVETTALPSNVLSTCDVDSSLSTVHPVPTCYTNRDGKLVMYHELRSAGYTVGYLQKTVAMPTFGLFGNQSLITTIATVVGCFLVIIGIMLFCLRYYFIKPIRNLVAALRRDAPSTLLIEASGVQELQTLAIAAQDALRAVQESEQRTHQLEYEAKLVHVVRQLSHDIRSPLAALKVVRELSTNCLSNDLSKLLSKSIDRITDIANTILPKIENTDSNNPYVENCFLWIFVDQIVSEKRVQYKNIEGISIHATFEPSPFSLNALCNPTDFMRAISNILNNSVEAKIANRPLSIKITVKEYEDKIFLTITDDGKGIPQECLLKVLDEGFTSGKKNGSGLGLYQVKQAIESWGGKINIESVVNVGTTVTAELKKSAKPIWLFEEIDIHIFENIYVLDDEKSIFNILKKKFNPYSKRLTYFSKIVDFEKKLPASSNSLFFIDYDLKQNLTGIELIHRHNLQNNSILLTGNYDERSVQKKAIEIGLKILPKPLISELPITM